MSKAGRAFPEFTCQFSPANFHLRIFFSKFFPKFFPNYPSPHTSSPNLPSAIFGMTQSSQLANSATTIQEATTLFSQQLTSAQSWKRGPYKLEEALQQATSAPPQDTTTIFLSKGHSVWLAYFLAKSASAVHCEGPRSHAEKLTAFEQLSTADRTSVAAHLAGVNVHTTLQSTIIRIDSILSSVKRRRKLASRLFTPLITYLSGLNSEQPSVPAPSTTMRLPSETQNAFTTNYQTMRDSASAAEPAHTTTSIPTDASSVSNISHPATERLPPIFPLYLCGAISKLGDKANLTMTFPADDSGRIDCLMSLVISPNKVQHVARELFGTNLETDGNIWYIIQENGGRLLPGPELHLQGAQDEGINKLLGNSVSSAIKGSPVRREEIREAILATSCVTLIITRLPQEGAVLNLNLEIGEGFRLKRALFD